ncbi:MAG: SHOCT domain-containing protein, partial [Actinomycetota bacterium]|nr:SHOCT domain-containing protein [Actinomycetota bacterium]
VAAALAAQQGADSPAPPAPPAADAPAADVITQLQQLGELRDAGVLTEQEFAVQKAKILGA